MKKSNKIEAFIASGVSVVFTIYIGILIAPAFDPDSLWETLENLNAVIKSPFSLCICENTLKVILVLLLIDVCIGGYIFATHKNRRPGEEHGSAKFQSPAAVNKYISDKDFFKNRILTQHIRLSVTGRKAPISLNTLVVGGMGMGKSWFTLIANLLQANTSFVVTDPSKELIKLSGWFLKNIAHYDVKVLDLESPEHSMHYNFFRYIQKEDDCLRIVNIIFDATEDIRENKSRMSSDPMWENMAKAWLLSLVLLLFYRGTPNEQNIETVVWLLDEDFLQEDKRQNRVRTPVMALFDELEQMMPGNMATRNYRSATDGAVVTIQGVKSTLRGRISKFLLPSIQNLMSRDELGFDEIGKKKTALFLVVPSEDRSFNFIVSMVYAQLFPMLYRLARQQPDNKLPVPVQFMNDEQANFVMPPEFDTYVTTGRKHGISYMMFYQELGQVKKQFPNSYQTLTGTCNTFVYLGGSGKETNKEISEWIGSETISSFQYNRTYGFRGSYGRQEHISKRELMLPDEIDTKLSNTEALCYVKGKGWVIDNKNDPTRHPNFCYLAGQPKGQVYEWDGRDIISGFMQIAASTAERLAEPDFTINIDAIESFKIEEKYNIKIYD